MRTPSGKQRSATTAAAAAPDRPIRLCDSCYRVRARWYCASDDAFLCQDCDATVHSTNPLASRHHRLRLNSTFSSSPSTTPGWHNGFKRKPRTPRPHHHSPKSWFPAAPVIQPIVPEIDTSIDNEDDKEEEEEEEESQILYQVPIFNPDLAEFRSPPPPLEDIKPAIQLPLYNSQPDTSADGLLPTEVELAEFTADMESLLGPETMEINFDSVSPAITGDDDVAAGEEPRMMRVGLRLDYEAVIAEWSTHGSSPWTDSQRPMFGPGYENWWPDEYMMVGGATWSGGGGGIIDGGREARVSRYREKRRRRLFSKKIRYEVRKLNAEKRPRMKGRFVKRAAVAAGRAF